MFGPTGFVLGGRGSMSIEEAIKLIRSKYEDNKDKKWVQNPVAYTLYEVWKIVDSKVVYHPSESKEET